METKENTMNIYRIIFTATVGQALIKAKSQAEASRKLDLTPHGTDTADVKFQEWDEPELLDISADDIEETMPDKSIFDRDEIRRAFGPLTPTGELLEAAKAVRDGWPYPNLTGPMARLNAAIAAVEEE
jgi:hypothetical protein